jgi:hypothetical protein
LCEREEDDEGDLSCRTSEHDDHSNRLSSPENLFFVLHFERERDYDRYIRMPNVTFWEEKSLSRRINPLSLLPVF